VQLNLRPDLLVQLEVLLLRSPSPLVFDHLAHIPRDNGVEHPAFKTMRKLIDKGHTWVKLSGAYQDTTIGAPTYAFLLRHAVMSERSGTALVLSDQQASN
jgi:D-galactarolactone isomerase